MTLLRTTRDADVAASAQAVMALLAEVADWPLLLARIVHVEPLATVGLARLAHIWGLSPDGIDEHVCRITPGAAVGDLTVARVVARPPASSLTARWHAEGTGTGRSRLTLSHEYEAIADDVDAAALLHAQLGADAESDVASMGRAAEILATHPACRFAFAEDVALDTGSSADAAFEFLRRPERWPGQPPGIASLAVREERPGIQLLELGIEQEDGSVRAEVAARLSLPQRRLLVHKSVRPRPLVFGHTSVFWVEPGESGGGSVGARHTLLLDPSAVASALGPQATLAEASDMVRRAISAESKFTLLGAAAAGQQRLGGR
jgi:aromatase